MDVQFNVIPHINVAAREGPSRSGVRKILESQCGAGSLKLVKAPVVLSKDVFYCRPPNDTFVGKYQH